MNILHFTYSLSKGGRLNAILSLAHGLDNLSENIFIASLTDSDEEAEFNLKNNNIFLNGIFFNKKDGSLTKSKSLSEKLAKFCTDNSIDIIHTHDAASQIITSIIKSKHNKIIHVHTFHRSLDIDTAGIKDRIRNLYANSFTDIITVGSTDRKQYFSKYNNFVKNKIEIIPFGINIDAFTRNQTFRKLLRERYDIPKNTIVFGTVGHYRKEKGVDQVIKAFSKFDKGNNNNNAVLYVLGTGTYKQTQFIRDLIKSENLENKVFLVGHDDDIPKWYSFFDVYLHGARQEAFGLVIIEAMAAGLPVIANSVGGIADIIEDGLTGYLIEKQSISIFSEKINHLATCERDRAKFSDNAIRRVEKLYCLNKYAQNYINLYKKLLNS